jgi:hypothetical protein
VSKCLETRSRVSNDMVLVGLVVVGGGCYQRDPAHSRAGSGLPGDHSPG